MRRTLVQVLVTGAFGFVGNAVVRELARAGHEVHALTSRREPARRVSLPVARVWHADVRARGSLSLALQGADVVCHLAAVTGARGPAGQAAELYAVNVEGTRNLVDAVTEAARASGRRPLVVLASSAAVYGPQEGPIAEQATPDPATAYGGSKVESELILHAAAASGHIAGAVLRCFNISGAVAGVGDRNESRIIPATLAVAAGRARELRVFGEGNAVRDFVHVGDAALAFRLALEAVDAPRYRCYNVGATGACVNEIVQQARRLTGTPIPVRNQHPTAPEVSISLADTRHIREELGWLPRRSSLTDILRDAWRAVDLCPTSDRP
jgi:UDP-glucose 4-epimerase